MRIGYWSSDVCSSDLFDQAAPRRGDIQLGQDFGIRLACFLALVERHVGVAANLEAGRVVCVAQHLQGFFGLAGVDQQPRQALLQDLLQGRSEEHTSELQSLMRISYAVFCLKKKNRIYT